MGEYHMDMVLFVRVEDLVEVQMVRVLVVQEVD